MFLFLFPLVLFLFFFTHVAGGVVDRVVWVKLPVDPRFWLPEQSPFTLGYDLGVGKDVPEGNYTLALLLAEAAMTQSPADAPQPSYSIQLANVGTWNSTTGYNNLGENRTTFLVPTGSSLTLFQLRFSQLGFRDGGPGRTWKKSSSEILLAIQLRDQLRWRVRCLMSPTQIIIG
jgi:hypothetical protein